MAFGVSRPGLRVEHLRARLSAAAARLGPLNSGTVHLAWSQDAADSERHALLIHGVRNCDDLGGNSGRVFSASRPLRSANTDYALNSCSTDNVLRVTFPLFLPRF